MKTYRVTLMRNLRMLRHAGFTLIMIPVMAPIIAKIKGMSFMLDEDSVKIILIIYLIFEIPALIIHIQYLIENFRTELRIYPEMGKIQIKVGKNAFEYNFEDIIMSKLYRSIYYKEEVDGKWRMKAPISDYGYWFLKFEDGKKFYFTSLMIDTSLDPLIDGTQIKYRFYSLIERDEFADAEIKKRSNDNFESGVKIYMDKFRHLSIKDLNQRIENKDSFQKEAYEAFVRLVNEKENDN